jgi:hypothetical protein
LVPYKTVEGRKINLTSILFSFPKKVEKQTMTAQSEHFSNPRFPNREKA